MVSLFKQYFIRQMDHATVSLPNKQKHMMCRAPCCSLRQVSQLAGSVAHLQQWRMTFVSVVKSQLSVLVTLWDRQTLGDRLHVNSSNMILLSVHFSGQFNPPLPLRSSQNQLISACFSFED